MHIKSLSLCVALFLISAIAGCGVIRLGSTSANDAVPVGTVIVQGSFISQNGQTVTGAALIYSTASGYLLRLAGISAPSEAALQVIVRVNSGVYSQSALLSNSGSKNYSLPDPPLGMSWAQSQVSIYSSLTAKDYGIALLQ